MEKKIILNKSLKSPLSSTSKDDLFLLLTIDDTKIVWLIKSVLPSNQSIDEFWKLIEIIIPFGVKIKGVMVNSADNISVSSVFLLNHRYKILRKIFSDALYFISFSMESDEEGEYHAKILKDSMMIENDKSKLIDDYSIEFDDNDVSEKCESDDVEKMFHSSMVHHAYIGLNNYCNRCGQKLDWSDKE